MSGLGDMGNLLKQAQEMQRQLDKAKTDLRERQVEGQAGGGAVRIVLSGDRQEVHDVHVDADLVRSMEPGMLEDTFQAALRDALHRSHELEKEILGRVTGGMNLPGLF